jgi:GMP synthase-like glutamine amidotransferase
LSARGRISIGVLTTGEPPGDLGLTFGDYPAMFRALLGETDFVFTEFDVRRPRGLPASPTACAAYVVTGSPAGAYDPDPWIAELRRWLVAAKGRAALVGVCFGHQFMAEAFGGRVIQSPRGWGVGLHAYAVRGPEPWMAPGPEIRAPASHQDQVVALPPGAQVLAGSDFTPNGMLAYDDQSAISIQLHPEFDPAYAKALIAGRRGGQLAADLADQASASLDGPNDCARIGTWISAFLRQQAIGGG